MMNRTLVKSLLAVLTAGASVVAPAVAPAQAQGLKPSQWSPQPVDASADQAVQRLLQQSRRLLAAGAGAQQKQVLPELAFAARVASRAVPKAADLPATSTAPTVMEGPLRERVEAFERHRRQRAGQLAVLARQLDAAASAGQLEASRRLASELVALLRPSVPQGGAQPGTAPAPSSASRPAATRGQLHDRAGLAVRLAANGGLSGITLPDDQDTEIPGPGDLNFDSLTQPDAAIVAQVAALQAKPVLVANWVRNNIRFVPGWGATQTAASVLATRRGNAADIATLLVAMLRQAQVPARYVYGTIRLEAPALQRWLGLPADAAARAFIEAGVPAQWATAADGSRTLTLEHVWVEAWVSGVPSRGAVRATGDSWWPLDASRKDEAAEPGPDLTALVPLNATGLFDAARSSATCTADSAAGLNLESLRLGYTGFRDAALARLDALAAEADVGAVLGRRYIRAQNHAVLLGTLPHAVLARSVGLASLPPALRWRLRLQLAQPGLPALADTEFDLAELGSRRLTLAFVPETPDDAQALTTLLPQQGLPLEAPAYVIRLRAEVRLGDDVLFSGGSFTPGQWLGLETTLRSANATLARGSQTLVAAGELHAWAVDAYGLGPDALEPTRMALAPLQAGQAGAMPAREAAARALHALAQAHAAAVDADAELASRTAQARAWRQPGLVRASTRLEPVFTFGLLSAVRPAGLALVVDRATQASSSVADAAGADVARRLVRQSLERSSAQAHALLERVFGPQLADAGGHSAVRAVARAAQAGVPVQRLHGGNAASLLPQLDLPEPFKAALWQSVADGQLLLVPRQPVQALGVSVAGSLAASHAPAALTTVADATAAAEEARQASARIGGLSGWLGLADASTAAALLATPAQALGSSLNASQALLGPVEAQRWNGFLGRDAVVDALFTNALASPGVDPTADACDWLASVVAGQLGSGAVFTDRVNRAPQISSVPVTYAAAGSAYAYAAQAQDPDGDPLRWRLSQEDGQPLPSGLGIDAAGLLRWASAQPGSYALVLRVDDGQAVAEQRFTLTVGTEPAPLELQVALAPSIANPGQTVTVTALASGGAGGAITLAATLDDAALPLVAGQAQFAAPASGTHRIRITATSAPVAGATPAPQVRELLLTVRDPADVTPPAAAITQPAADSEVTAPVDVLGTATDPRFAYYQLLLRPAGADAAAPWQEISRGLAPVAAGVLGRLDPATLANGAWDLALRVVDTSGQTSQVSVPLEVARDRKIGQFRLSFTDIRAEASGLPLLLMRSYDSLRRNELGDFGWGWFASANEVTVRKNMVLGINWQVQPRGLELCIVPASGKRRVTLTLPDGGVYRFQARNDPECAFGSAPPVNIVYDPLPLPVGAGAGSTAQTGQLQIVLETSVQAQGGQLVDMDSGLPFNPQRYAFTSPEGMRYILHETRGIEQIQDPYGNAVLLGAGGYEHSAGGTTTWRVQFERDASGRITKATDPQGKSVAYAYNAQGELASVTDRAGQTTRFAYGSTTLATAAGSVNNRHLLQTITDPRGQVVLQSQFDEYGRLQAAADAQGQTATQTVDEASSTLRTVDRRGHPSTYTFDAAGNVTRIVDALGGNTDIGYDASGNELTRTNPLGHTTTKTYDAVTGRVLTEADPLGRTTRTQYPAVGRPDQRLNPQSVTDPRGNTTTYAYPPGQDQQPGAVPSLITEPLGRTTAIGIDAKGNLQSLNIAGNSTTYTYDAQGRKTAETDALGKTTRYTYDAAGNELTRSVSRTVGGVTRTETTTRAYDAEGRLTRETDATGATRSSTYNQAGKIETSTDALGRVTRYSYDANARLVRTEHPDGSAESIEYDANGNETGRTDRQGHTTRMEFDALNRHTKTIHPDGSAETMEYDAAGRLIASVNAQGARSTSEYDAAGQQTASVDASGRRTEHSHDANGNRTQTKLPDGRLVKFTYDELNRLTRTEYPDGSTHTVSYRADGRKQIETDPRGTTSTYGYDAKGQLTSVVQSGVSTATTYAYDEQGAKTTQTDALGRQVKWTYDAAGRPISRTLPDGSKETFQYDLEGQLTARTTFGGNRIQSTYDATGREITRIIPATANTPARTVSWTYDPEGRRLTQTESGETSAQGTTRYRYDARGRLVEQAMPQGTLTWAYDNEGRVTERSTSEGTSRYQYDGNGRLAQLTAPDGKTTVYSYDAAGRNTRTVQQLNPGIELVTDKRFDNQDRQTHIAHSKQTQGAKTLIAGQRIYRGTGGAVSRIDTFDETAGFDAQSGSFSGNPSRIQVFGYDANARLTSEKEYKLAAIAAFIANPAAPATKATSYGYDDVGNRISKTMATAAGTETTAYAYDSNDRLTTETLTTATGSTLTTTYTWDGNGNMASKAGPGEYTGYIFDADNRLIEVRRGASQAAATSIAKYGYDADGQRIRKQTPTETTNFLIDTTTTWPQVVLETQTTGQATQSTAYVWGAELRQQTRGGQGTLFGNPAEDLVPLPGHLGTTIAAGSKAGAALERYEGGAFGEGIPEAARLTHLFAGEYWEPEALLVYLRARWYDSRVGKFLSIDPFWGRDGDQRSHNRYVYAAGDPIQNLDPAGEEALVGSQVATTQTVALQNAARIDAVRKAFDVLNAVCKSCKNIVGSVRHHIVPWFMRGSPGTKTWKAGELLFVNDRIHHKFHALLNQILLLQRLTPGWKGKAPYQLIRSGGDMKEVYAALLIAAELFDAACIQSRGSFSMTQEVVRMRYLFGMK